MAWNHVNGGKWTDMEKDDPGQPGFDDDLEAAIADMNYETDLRVERALARVVVPGLVEVV